MTFIIFCLSINWMKEGWEKSLIWDNTQTHWPCTSRQMLNKSVNCWHGRYKSCEVLAAAAGCSFGERGAGTHKPVWQTHISFHCSASRWLCISQETRMWLSAKTLQILFCMWQTTERWQCYVRKAGARILDGGNCSHPEQGQAVYIWDLNLILI